ncbi:hypothetical protein NDU88_008654 [Pleurodeles waltl]|uniref:Uncharacterized protein n=1 Tax=Pleurodeles waltl TaxID=8319 RepID=A0AAV7NZV9_PLEWA|nr:hypothetical protein NDU88_008654 [Pleurodeles waltl]
MRVTGLGGGWRRGDNPWAGWDCAASSPRDAEPADVWRGDPGAAGRSASQRASRRGPNRHRGTQCGGGRRRQSE